MKAGFLLYRLGCLGLVLTAGIAWEEPLADSLRQNPTTWFSVAILYGFTSLAGLLILFVQQTWLERDDNGLFFFSHGAALLATLWLVLWCFVWLAMLANMGDKAVMLIKHTAYLHLFGVGFSMAGYATGWMASRKGEKSARFLMTVGWAVSYMAWFNLYLQPTLQALWAPAVGGLLVVLGAFLIERQLKGKVEAPSQLS